MSNKNILDIYEILRKSNPDEKFDYTKLNHISVFYLMQVVNIKKDFDLFEYILTKRGPHRKIQFVTMTQNIMKYNCTFCENFAIQYVGVGLQKDNPNDPTRTSTVNICYEHRCKIIDILDEDKERIILNYDSFVV